MTEKKQGFLERLGLAFKFFQGMQPTSSQVTGYAPTSEPYLPSHLMYPVDGSRFGSNQTSLEAVRTAEEFSVAVKRLAEGLSSLEIRIQDASKNPIRDNHPLAVLLDQPNPLQDWTTWIETAVYMLIPTGDTFILLDPVSLAGTPMALWLLRPDRTRPIRGDQPAAPVEGYEHFAEDGVRYVFPTESVIHIKMPNPITPYRGLGATQMIATTMAMDAASLAFNWAFFKQGGRLSTIIEFPNKMSPDAWKEYQAKLQSAYMGTVNAHRLLVLDEGAKMNTTASNANPKEVDFPETRKDISRVTGALLGVPPIHMGHVDNANRSNSVTQDQIFYKQGIAPLAKRFARALTQIAKKFGKFQFEFIMPNVEDPDVLNNRATAGSASGAYSPNDVRELFGDERDPDPAMDTHLVPFNMQPIGFVVDNPEANARAGAALVTADANANAAPAEGAQPTQTPGGLPLPAKIEAGKPGAPAAPGAGGKPGELPVPAKLSKKNAEFPKGTMIQRRVLKYAVSKRGSTEKRMTKAYRAWIIEVGTQAAADLGGSEQHRGLQTLPGKAMPIIAKAVEATAAQLHAKLSPVLDAELQAFYTDLAGLFQVDDADQTFIPGSPAFEGARARLAQRVTGVAESIKSDIQNVVAEGMAQGLSAYEIANGTADGSFEGVKDVVDGMAQERAQLIARTETVAMQNQASVGAYKDMGVTVLDVIGCQDFVIMPGQTYGCNSQGIPLDLAASIEFHPNHDGAIVPRLEKAVHQARALSLFHVEQKKKGGL